MSDTRFTKLFFQLPYRFLKDMPATRYPFADQIKENLLKARIRVGYTIYISAMVFWSFITYLVTLITVVAYYLLLFPPFGSLVSIIVSVIVCIFVPVIICGTVVFLFSYYPNYVANEHRIKIKKNLVYISNFLYLLSSSGATSEQVFFSLAKIEDYFGVKSSARAIMQDVELLGSDIITSIDNESTRTPCPEYTDLLQGYLSTIISGGSVTTYLAAASNQLIELRRRDLAELIKQLDIAGELYVALLVAFPVILITMLSIMGGFSGDIGGGLSPSQMMSIIVYLLVPGLGLMILLLVDGYMSGW